VREEPLTAINTLQPLRIQPPNDFMEKKHRVQTHYAASYPETPLTAHPMSPMHMEMSFPSSVMTATPPLSAGPTDTQSAQVFTFMSMGGNLNINTHLNVNGDIAMTPLIEPKPPRRRAALSGAGSLGSNLPYTHPRSLHSILRNSPLPPSSAKTPISPRRQSLRLQEKAARRVGYNNPLTQTITTNKYTRSHIDLLVEDVSPNSPASAAAEEPQSATDIAMAFTADETRDGGMTPGPFEEMRRRMAGLGTGTPVSPGGGVRKRKKKEKKRRWVWTIGQEEDEEDLGGAMAAIKAAEATAVQPSENSIAVPEVPAVHPYVEIPTPSVESFDSEMESLDIEMSDTNSLFSVDRAITPNELDFDLQTPVKSSRIQIEEVQTLQPDRLGSMDLINPETGSRRDTPIPPELVLV
jgi:hypothetical protein